MAVSMSGLGQGDRKNDVLTSSTKTLNWRTGTKALLDIQMTARPEVNATLVVWAFGSPSDAPKGPASDGRPSAQPGESLKVGRIVHVANLGK